MTEGAFFTLKSKLHRLTASLSSFSLRFRFCGGNKDTSEDLDEDVQDSDPTSIRRDVMEQWMRYDHLSPLRSFTTSFPVHLHVS